MLCFTSLWTNDGKELTYGNNVLVQNNCIVHRSQYQKMRYIRRCPRPDACKTILCIDQHKITCFLGERKPEDEAALLAEKWPWACLRSILGKNGKVFNKLGQYLRTVDQIHATFITRKINSCLLAPFQFQECRFKQERRSEGWVGYVFIYFTKMPDWRDSCSILFFLLVENMLLVPARVFLWLWYSQLKLFNFCWPPPFVYESWSFRAPKHSSKSFLSLNR